MARHDVEHRRAGERTPGVAAPLAVGRDVGARNPSAQRRREAQQPRRCGRQSRRRALDHPGWHQERALAVVVDADPPAREADEPRSQERGLAHRRFSEQDHVERDGGVTLHDVGHRAERRRHGLEHHGRRGEVVLRAVVVTGALGGETGEGATDEVRAASAVRTFGLEAHELADRAQQRAADRRRRQHRETKPLAGAHRGAQPHPRDDDVGPRGRRRGHRADVCFEVGL